MATTPFSMTDQAEEKLSRTLDEILPALWNAGHKYGRLIRNIDGTPKQITDAKAYIMQLIAEARDQGGIEFRDRLSTGGRPLSAEPLIEEQPVPCPECGAEKYAGFAMYPHQIYNAVYPGGSGHPCVPCFAKRVLANPEPFLAETHKGYVPKSKTDRNGDPIVGDVLDIIDKGDSQRYKVAVRVAEYIRNNYATQADVDRAVEEARKEGWNQGFNSKPVVVNKYPKPDGIKLTAPPHNPTQPLKQCPLAATSNPPRRCELQEGHTGSHQWSDPRQDKSNVSS